MLDQLKQYLGGVDQRGRLNNLREYLQWLALKIIDEKGFRKSLVFVGGTALRIIYGNGRFSEDLDFSSLPGEKIDFKDMAETIQRELGRYGLTVSITSLKAGKTVGSCFFRFSGLLNPLNISKDPRQNLSVKLEVDQRPPAGGSVSEYFFNGPLLFSMNHHDLPSLFSGKLHALLFRKYAKGRDYYDLLFYFRKKCRFNLPLFQNAVRQTNPDLAFPDAAAVLTRLRDIIQKMDETAIQRDVAPFIIEPDELRFLTSKFLLMALDQNRESGVYKDS